MREALGLYSLTEDVADLRIPDKTFNKDRTAVVDGAIVGNRVAVGAGRELRHLPQQCRKCFRIALVCADRLSLFSIDVAE